MNHSATDRYVVTSSVKVVPSAGSPAALSTAPATRHTRSRIVSTVVLLVMLAGVAFGARAAYHALSDSYVAPIILSPDADVVIQQKSNLTRMMAERSMLLTRIEESRSTADSIAKARAELQELRVSLQHGLEWTKATSTRQRAYGAVDLSTLRRQQRVFADMIREQENYLAEMRRDLAAGLIRKDDYQRESSTLSNLRVAALQNQREQRATELTVATASEMKRALATANKKKALLTPEMQTQREQLVRITVEMLKYESDERSKRAQIQTDQEALAKLDELLAQIKQRPIYRAIQASQDVAFVPYTQLDGVVPGVQVFNCTVWGVFACENVGVVAEILPGEVVTQDPWGSPARGQYAILALNDRMAARSKVLRVRKADLPEPSQTTTH